MKNTLLLTLLFSLLFIACDVEVESADPGKIPQTSNGEIVTEVTPIETSMLDGEVGGRAWTFIKGRVKASRFIEGAHDFDFWNEDVRNPCDSYTFGSDRQITGTFPLAVGKLPMGMRNNITFFYNNNNLVVTRGTFVIESIENDTVRGKLTAKYDGKNYIDGEFELILCK